MSDLETLVRNMVRTEDVQAIQLFPAKGRWQANLKLRDNPGWRVELHDDPAEALRAVLAPPALPETVTSMFD